MRRSNLDQSRFDEKRRDKTFIRYEIDRLTANPLTNGYYEPSGDLPPEFVSCHCKNPLDRKQNEAENELVSCHEGGPNDGKQNLDFKSVDELIFECGDGPDWVAHGFLARGWLTDLAGPAKKSGKTTLVMYLVRSILD